MVKFLARLFIKNYKDTTNEKVRISYGSMAGIIGIISNFILVCFKLFIGIITSSISIIADGINNLSDMGNSIITIVGFKISGKPADKKHPFGHQRMEYVISLIISMIIMFVGLELLIQSVKKIITPDPIDKSYITYIILGVAVLIKVFQGLFYLNSAKIINSLSLKASAKDSINDFIATSAVIVGLVISRLTDYNCDGIIGCVVSVMIIWSGLGLIKEAISPLLGEAPDKELIHKIVDYVKKNEGILGVHDVIAHLYGPRKVFISLHAEVDASVDVLTSHELVDRIEHEVKNKFECDIVIHMDPIVLNDKNQNEVKAELANVLKGIGTELKFHDFRMVPGKNNSNLIFDVLVPYEYKLSNDEVASLVKAKMREINPKYTCIINIDNDYTGEA